MCMTVLSTFGASTIIVSSVDNGEGTLITAFNFPSRMDFNTCHLLHLMSYFMLGVM